MKRNQLLDYGRFFAALNVVFFHYLFNGITNGKITSIEHVPMLASMARYGFLGVEFFFMISGYVIFLSAQGRTASEFIVSRATRLYPAFWTAVLFTAMVSYFLGGKMSVTLPQVLVNLTMAAPIFGFTNVDGVYWTLLLELKFYLMVAVLLFVGLSHRLKDFFLAWPWLIAVSTWAGIDYLPLLGGYYAYFAAGAVLAILKEERTMPVIASLIAAAVLCIRYSAGKLPSALEQATGIPYSGVVVGCIILSFFIFFFLINSVHSLSLKIYQSKLLGSLTYPLYLVHAHFGYMVISRFATEENKFLVYIITFLLAMMVAYAIHILIEKRLANTWSRLFQRVLGRPVAAANTKFVEVALIFRLTMIWFLKKLKHTGR